MTTQERIEAIQSRLGLEPDGLIGPVTLTAIERLLDKVAGGQAAGQAAGQVAAPVRMTCSTSGLDMLVGFEISSEGFYHQKLRHPTWPGSESGVTIGIGYDLGFSSIAQLHRDWDGHIADADVLALEVACKQQGQAARQLLRNRPSLAAVVVPLTAAQQVFYLASLPTYAQTCLKAYPGVQHLPADAQSAMLSLVYNRGANKSGSSRSEMKDLTGAIETGDLEGMALLLESMKRLWEGRNLDGLLKRRDQEAELVRRARRHYAAEELVLL